VLEKLQWLGKRSHPDLKADALLFQGKPGRFAYRARATTTKLTLRTVVDGDDRRIFFRLQKVIFER